MPRVATINGIAIFVYANDHSPPHFHAIDGDTSVLIAIADFRIIAGALPAKKISAVCAWAKKNRETLQATWDRLNP